jgi:hypothetical protein
MEPQKVSAMPIQAKPGTDALDPPRGWAEGSTWTARLVSALATASRGHLRECPFAARRWVTSHHPRAGETLPMWKPTTGEPYAGEPHVRFGGRGGVIPFPTPIE